MKAELNEKTIRGLEPASVLKGGQERVILWDESQKGLGLTVHRSGTLTWVLRYSIHGRPGKITLGNWPDVPYSAAKSKAQKLRGNIADGIDPSRAKDTTTFKDLADRMREDYYPRLSDSTVRTYNMLLDRHILPLLGKLLVDEVALKDAARLHHKLKDQPRTANQALAVLSKALNMAETWGLREPNTNPCTAIQRFREEKRQRYLATLELVELGNRMRDIGPKWNPYSVAALRFAMLTGMRKGEVCALKWQDIKGGKITLKDHKTSKKTGDKVIPVTPPAMKILEEMERMLGTHLVFPGAQGGSCYHALRSLWDAIRAGTTFEDVRVHDLRHTFASFGVMEGLTLEQIGGLLGHKAAATTKRYAHLMEEAAMTAASKTAEAVADRLGSL